MNIAAIVGRPNVGKSTLFNRLIGRRSAIIESVPGVTRDRIYDETEWNGKNFTVIDTGGFIPGAENTMERAVREQAQIAIEEAGVVIFLCDGRDGITAFDSDIAAILRNSSKKTVLTINKCDNEKQDQNAYEFYNLGLGEPFPISAINGRGTGDFLDEVSSHFDLVPEEEKDLRLKIAIIGRPNSGKSTLSNAFIGAERSIVTEMPGTTRDSIDTTIKYKDNEIVLIDTAGLRKRSRIKENVELYSVLRTAAAIKRSDVSVVLLDAIRGFDEQDKKIINQVTDARKGIIVAINKWDLAPKDQDYAKEYRELFYEQMKTHYYAPVVIISAKNKRGIYKILDLAEKIKQNRAKRIKTSVLNGKLLEELKNTSPPAVRGKDLRINFITQVKSEPPLFVFFCNYPELIPDSYKRFLERKIRELFDFEGAPISFLFRKKNVKWEERDAY